MFHLFVATVGVAAIDFLNADFDWGWTGKVSQMNGVQRVESTRSHQDGNEQCNVRRPKNDLIEYCQMLNVAIDMQVELEKKIHVMHYLPFDSNDESELSGIKSASITGDWTMGRTRMCLMVNCRWLELNGLVCVCVRRVQFSIEKRFSGWLCLRLRLRIHRNLPRVRHLIVRRNWYFSFDRFLRPSSISLEELISAIEFNATIALFESFTSERSHAICICVNTKVKWRNLKLSADAQLVKCLAIVLPTRSRVINVCLI